MFSNFEIKRRRERGLLLLGFHVTEKKTKNSEHEHMHPSKINKNSYVQKARVTFHH